MKIELSSVRKARQQAVAKLMFYVVLAFVSGIGVATLAGCRPPDPGTWRGKVVDCATEEFSREWPRVAPEAATCLSSLSGDPMRCLDGLPTLLKVGVDVVACVVRGQGQRAAAQVSRNRADTMSALQAERAQEWIDRHAFVFREGAQ